MGSIVALRFALDHPNRTAALVLAGAFPTVKGHPDVQALWDATLSTLADPIPAAFARDFQTSTIARPIAPAQLETFVAESLRVPARVWRAAFREFLTTDFSADLPRIQAPALILAGGKDTFSRRHERDLLAARLPRAQVIDYPDIGHALHWEDPARIGADIARFLAAVDVADEA
jgi:pimeloyl-ACP methyl ester carboxylesterase